MRKPPHTAVRRVLTSCRSSPLGFSDARGVYAAVDASTLRRQGGARDGRLPASLFHFPHVLSQARLRSPSTLSSRFPLLLGRGRFSRTVSRAAGGALLCSPGRAARDPRPFTPLAAQTTLVHPTRRRVVDGERIAGRPPKQRVRHLRPAESGAVRRQIQTDRQHQTASRGGWPRWHAGGTRGSREAPGARSEDVPVLPAEGRPRAGVRRERRGAPSQRSPRRIGRALRRSSSREAIDSRAIGAEEGRCDSLSLVRRDVLAAGRRVVRRRKETRVVRSCAAGRGEPRARLFHHITAARRRGHRV